MAKASAEDILRTYWGYDSFRPGQWEMANAAAEGTDVLGILPTGAGKSVTFQVPGLMRGGLTLVVSPLISLMKDQVEALEQRGISAVALHSALKPTEQRFLLRKLVEGKYQFLYVSPERLATESFREYLVNMQVNLLVVDEAHCVSQWGYDFRPPYLQIPEIRHLLPKKIPIMALTASATPKIQQDLIEKLALQHPFIFIGEFYRKNLHFHAIRKEDKLGTLTSLMRAVPGSGIVFGSTRKSTMETADFLQNQGFSADFYHAGLLNKERTFRQESWINNSLQYICATNAFGMGIDKPEVRLVVHTEPPAGPEAYYQEAGRAGRDGKDAWCVLLYTPADFKLIATQIEDQFPPLKLLERVYHALMAWLSVPPGGGAGQTYDFEPMALSEHYKIPIRDIAKSLKSLELLDYISLSEAVLQPSKIRITAEYTEVYEFKLKYRGYQKVLDALMRSYAGIFDYYVVVREQEISRKIRVAEESLIQTFNELTKLGIIDYSPSNDRPKITLLEPRSVYPIFGMARLDQLKEIRKEKLRDLWNYVSTDACRADYWSKYFTENSLQTPCGNCDFCVKQKRENELPEKINEEIEQWFVREGGELNPEKAKELFMGKSKKWKSAFEEFMAKGKIIETNDGGWKWQE